MKKAIICTILGLTLSGCVVYDLLRPAVQEILGAQCNGFEGKQKDDCLAARKTASVFYNKKFDSN